MLDAQASIIVVIQFEFAVVVKGDGECAEVEGQFDGAEAAVGDGPVYVFKGDNGGIREIELFP